MITLHHRVTQSVHFMLTNDILQNSFIGVLSTVIFLSFRTNRSGQTVQTVCHSVCIDWTHYSMVEPHSSNFRVITTNFLGVRIFRKFTVNVFIVLHNFDPLNRFKIYACNIKLHVDGMPSIIHVFHLTGLLIISLFLSIYL